PQRLTVAYFANRLRFAKFIHRLGEVTREWADDRGLGERRGLDHIAAMLSRAEIDERASDEDDAGDTVELSQLAHRVAKHDWRNRVVAAAGRGRTVRSSHGLEAMPLDQLGHLVE